MMSLLYINYYAVYFLAASMGGNKFINCALIGIGEVTGCLVSGYVLIRMNDNVVFMISSIVTCVANFVFYAVPEGFP